MYYYSIFQQLFKFVPRYRFEKSVENLPVALLHQVHRQMPVRHHGTGKPSPRHAHVRLRPARSPQSEQGHAEETSRLECP